MNIKDKIIDRLEKYYYRKQDNISNENSVENISEIGGIGARGIGGTPVVQQTKMPIPEPQRKKTPGLEKILDLITTEDSELSVSGQMKKLKKVISPDKKKK
jgi:hypothetical protein